MRSLHTYQLVKTTLIRMDVFNCKKEKRVGISKNKANFVGLTIKHYCYVVIFVASRRVCLNSQGKGT